MEKSFISKKSGNCQCKYNEIDIKNFQSFMLDNNPKSYYCIKYDFGL